MKIFFDMDGTLAKFYEDNKCLEKMYERGFFYGLKPYKNMVKVVRNLIKDGAHDIYILSACVDTEYCEAEKIAWIQHYIPGIAKSHIIMCKTGENKAEVAAKHCEENPSENYILVDDYSRNIYDWELYNSHYVALKFLNGINDTTQKTYKYKFKNTTELRKILKSLY